MAAHAAQGTEIQSGDGGGPPELFTTIGKVTNIAGPNLHNPVIDGTGLEDAWRIYISSGLVGVDAVVLTVLFDPDTVEIHDTLVDRAIASSSDNYIICWSNLTANNFAFVPADVTVVADTIDENAHGLHQGQPVQVGTDDTLPDPLVANTTYYVIWTNANVFQLALTNADAVAGTQIVLLDQGVGNHALYYGQKFSFAAYIDDASPEGTLGEALTGTISMQVTDTMSVAD
ncbi:MAG TPA: hypothetical protein VMW24_26560 [Sedimentisphaerales bacterium]|nr:hypothetical protein [Sedimentisphaerales bacterium]